MNYIEEFMNLRGFTQSQTENIRTATASYNFTEFKDEGLFLSKLHSVRFDNILIIPDYDVDGIMSGTIFSAGLSELGFEHISMYYPSNRFGYGMSVDSLKDALSKYPDTQVILTCDNGISSNEAVAEAKRMGLTVLITDHHPQRDVLPSADAVIDPSRIDETYPFSGICGAQVVYHLLLSYASHYNPACFDKISYLGVFAGIACVGDGMPMLEENRQLVRSSLYFIDHSDWDSISGYELSDNYKNAFYGLFNLKNILAENGKYKNVNEELFSYYLCPVLNSSRRVTGDSRTAFEVFTRHDMSDSATDNLYNLNEERKSVTASIFSELEENISCNLPVYFRTTPVLYGGQGYAGLIAGKLTERTGLPSVCFSVHSDETGLLKPENFGILHNVDYISGSGRSPGWFMLTDFLEAIKQEHPEFELTYGGHSQACGVSVKADYLSAFSEVFTVGCDAAYAEYVDSLPEGVLKEADFEFSIGRDVDNSIPIYNAKQTSELFDFLDALDEFRPFGNGFQKPSYKFSLRIPYFFIQTMGKNNVHAKLSSKSLPLEFLFWNEARSFENLSSDVLTVFGDLSVNEFNNSKKLSVKSNGFLFL